MSLYLQTKLHFMELWHVVPTWKRNRLRFCVIQIFSYQEKFNTNCKTAICYLDLSIVLMFFNHNVSRDGSSLVIMWNLLCWVRSIELVSIGEQIIKLKEKLQFKGIIFWYSVRGTYVTRNSYWLKPSLPSTKKLAMCVGKDRGLSTFWMKKICSFKMRNSSFMVLRHMWHLIILNLYDTDFFLKS
jgi:hypothetical protein